MVSTSCLSTSGEHFTAKMYCFRRDVTKLTGRQSVQVSKISLSYIVDFGQAEV